MKTSGGLFLALSIIGSLTATCVSAYSNGVKNSLDIAVIEQAKDVYFDEIVKLIDNLTLPDYYFDGNKGYMIENSFVLNETPDDVTFTTDSQANAIIFDVTDFRGTFYCNHFRYKELLLVAKGSVTVHMKKI